MERQRGKLNGHHANVLVVSLGVQKACKSHGYCKNNGDRKSMKARHSKNKLLLACFRILQVKFLHLILSEIYNSFWNFPRSRLASVGAWRCCDAEAEYITHCWSLKGVAWCWTHCFRGNVLQSAASRTSTSLLITLERTLKNRTMQAE